MLRLTRPGDDDLRRLLAEQSRRAPEYPGIGSTVTGDRAPDGYRRDRFEASLGDGERVWSRAVAALRRWEAHTGSGLLVVADGPVADGTTVAMAAPLPVGYVLAACRIVAVIDEPDTFGFAYGTLAVHPEEGEESFVVRRRDDRVFFEVVAFSRARHVLVRAAGPVARALQIRATRRYLRAMQNAVASSTGPDEP